MVAVLVGAARRAVGSILIAVTDERRARARAGYVTARPGDFLQATWDAIWGAYTALFRGAIYNTRAETFELGDPPAHRDRRSSPRR